MSTKFLKAAGLGLALIGAVAMPLHALAQSSQAAPASAVEAGSDMTVVIDAVTGKPRLPTDAERAEFAALKASKARSFRMAPKMPQPKVHASGARGARLTDDFMSTAIAVRQPDGSIAMQCFESKAEADAALKAGAATPLKLETE